MSTDVQSSFLKAIERQTIAANIETMCREYGAGTVIDVARAYIERKEREASAEHQRWRAQMIADMEKLP